MKIKKHSENQANVLSKTVQEGEFQRHLLPPALSMGPREA